MCCRPAARQLAPALHAATKEAGAGAKKNSKKSKNGAKKNGKAPAEASSNANGSASTNRTSNSTNGAAGKNVSDSEALNDIAGAGEYKTGVSSGFRLMNVRRCTLHNNAS